MSKLDITWSNFTVHKKHDIDRDKPYLWVYGLVIDANTLRSHDYVVRRRSDSDNLGKKFKKGESSSVPSDLDVHQSIAPLFGAWAGGVVVVAWENAMTKDSVIADAYDAGADTLNEIIAKKLKSGDPFSSPTDADQAAWGAEVAAAVKQTIKAGWTVFQLIPDNNIGSASWFNTYDGSSSHSLDFRFVHNTTDYELKGTIAYDAEGKVQPPPPPPPPPGKVLQSPKPQSTVRH